MTTDLKIKHGTTAWFEMLGEAMCDAAAKAGLPSDFTISVVEHFVDGAELSDGLFEGFRFNIVNGKPSFEIGARREERGDITLDVTKACSRELNMLHTDDPRYQAAVGRLVGNGEMKVDGDVSRLGSWLGPVHDIVVDRTV
ncbi:hypothetical protein [Rhizorhabdus dicambivorans]|uniref:SCP2 domain-containing protein n=1 Tax=Rhizorhabdus dicambivorans TaxID=1850238 RepID=A0A2A4FN13_9SPHN|nr:hypothetical protein [Rhizorhabdus dicambivorans]ATE67254.1 hypothetical protein CMV14_09865 [Rhizorhabdus dicambivorans]PCE39793.1 hypothetical protein COO09_23605 [Rhizorhabdus dicambivorans]